MMRISKAFQTGAVAALLGAVSAAAFAGPIGDRFSAAGRVELGFSPDRGEFSLAGDADAHLALGWGFSLNLGLFGAATDLTDEIDTPHETYGTLSWQSGGFSIAAGVPRPAYDSAVVSALDQLDPVRAIAADRLGATRSRVTWGAIHDGGLPLGIRVAGSAMDFDWAVSAHRMDDVEVAGFGVTWSPGGDDAVQLGLAAEWASDGSSGAKASAQRRFGDVTLAGTLFFAPAPAVPDLAEASLIWQAQPGLDVSLVVQAPREGDAAAAIGVEKDFGQAGYVKGALRLEGDDATALLAYGLHFGR